MFGSRQAANPAFFYFSLARQVVRNDENGIVSNIFLAFSGKATSNEDP